jgi:hypothetical protein
VNCGLAPTCDSTRPWQVHDEVLLQTLTSRIEDTQTDED